MISPELLRRYPFFGELTEDQLRAIAMIAETEPLESGTVLFRKGRPAQALYFLEAGCIDLFYSLSESTNEGQPEGIPVGEINPHEPFSISALIEPYVLTSTAWVSRPSQVIVIDAQKLRALFKKDHRLAYRLLRQTARAAIARLQATRVQLAAAWAQ
jgi:CRP/FNR family cyclic AMP-dependent transcriptional regulator